MTITKLPRFITIFRENQKVRNILNGFVFVSLLIQEIIALNMGQTTIAAFGFLVGLYALLLVPFRQNIEVVSLTILVIAPVLFRVHGQSQVYITAGWLIVFIFYLAGALVMNRKAFVLIPALYTFVSIVVLCVLYFGVRSVKTVIILPSVLPTLTILLMFYFTLIYLFESEQKLKRHFADEAMHPFSLSTRIVIHDLGNKLHSLNLALRLWQGNKNMKSFERLGSIIDSLSDFQESLRSRRVIPLGSVLGTLRHLLATECLSHDIQFSITNKIPPSSSIEIHPFVIRVIENLVFNAVRELGQCDQPRQLNIIFSLNHSLRIAVQDNGNGVPGHLVGGLFDPFESGAESSGLGLFSIREGLRTLDASVSYSRLGELSEFLITIPAPPDFANKEA